MLFILFLVRNKHLLELIWSLELFYFHFLFLLFLVMVFESSSGIRECLFHLICFGSWCHSNVSYFCCTLLFYNFQSGMTRRKGKKWLNSGRMIGMTMMLVMISLFSWEGSWRATPRRTKPPASYCCLIWHALWLGCLSSSKEMKTMPC